MSLPHGYGSRNLTILLRHMNILPVGAWFSLVSVTCDVDVNFYQSKRNLFRTYWCRLLKPHTEHRVYCSIDRLPQCTFIIICFFSQGVNVLLFQKTDDNKEQAIKKRKKREVSSLEEKSPKKNRVPKQGWESCQYDTLVMFIFLATLCQLVKLIFFMEGFLSLY